MLKTLAVLLLSLPAWAHSAVQLYTQPGCFTVSFPEGWTREKKYYGLAGSEKKVYGAGFLAPRPGKIPAIITVDYYAPGNLLYNTHEKYIRRHSKSALGVNMDGKVYGKVVDGRAGNYYAKVFERKTFDYFPKRSLNAKKLFIYEKFFVVPVKHGFYVLRYSAPLGSAKDGLKQFKATVASFMPLIR